MKKGLRIGISLGAILVAAGLAALLIVTREPPQKAGPQQRGVLVETKPVRLLPHRLDVRAKGTVIPAREVTIHPQIPGRIVMVHSNLVPGGLLNQGDVLVRIEQADYQIAVEEARTAWEQVQAQLRLEQGRQKVAEREWELFQDRVDKEARDAALALREPQLQAAKSAVQAAQVRLDRAKLDLKRTEIEAPFDSFVRNESVEPGQYVSPQSVIASLVGTDRIWIQASIPSDQLPYLDVPDLNANNGATVEVAYDVGSRRIVRKGTVIRLFGGLDPAGRMARLLLEVPDPLSLGAASHSDKPPVPLLIDTFVDLTIQGNRRKPLIEVPREAVHEGNLIHVLGENDKLEIRDTEVEWRRPDTLLIGEGLKGGERIVVSRIATPVEGLQLRTEDDSGSPPSSPSDEKEAQDGE